MIFKEICPGKHREYGLQRYLDAIQYCATLGPRGPRSEPWVTNGEIIVGLEPPESSIRAIEWITSVGAIPTVCVFRPLVGTDYASMPPPTTESIVPIFARLYECCMERGLPIGCAPDIHVSLVLLPEEAKWLTDRRYVLTDLKLAFMAKALRFALERRWRRREHQAGQVVSSGA